MGTNNPYDAPKSDVDNDQFDYADLDQAASGQKLIIYSILLNFVAIAGQHAFGVLLMSLVSIAALVMAIIGILRLSSGLGYSTGSKVLLIIGCFIPLINLIIMLVLSMKATSRLREAGYKVGLLGASR
ncbi:hypothetical protein GCM10007862_29970 [Dyella lipolytica]|uniref:DUF805 domain-containing protein n=1 Tax=Dyella lipolytica TaxID=1867835 RepID=A0ABW8IXI3_9GAMM|nr:hypothetical protein [Dyella lipolytica]GLQ47946.1 hypothetical protein GCM10007862_29970 [Dyella lipolytica]